MRPFLPMHNACCKNIFLFMFRGSWSADPCSEPAGGFKGRAIFRRARLARPVGSVRTASLGGPARAKDRGKGAAGGGDDGGQKVQPPGEFEPRRSPARSQAPCPLGHEGWSVTAHRFEISSDKSI